MADQQVWDKNFRRNLNKLYEVAPFANSSMGNFQQSFQGEWTANITNTTAEWL